MEDPWSPALGLIFTGFVYLDITITRRQSYPVLEYNPVPNARLV
jgi:hypothetical protein